MEFSAGACALLSEQRQEAVASNCTSAISAMSRHGCTVTTYGLSTDNDWSASSITPNLLGGQDYMLVSLSNSRIMTTYSL